MTRAAPSRQPSEHRTEWPGAISRSGGHARWRRRGRRRGSAARSGSREAPANAPMPGIWSGRVTSVAHRSAERRVRGLQRARIGMARGMGHGPRRSAFHDVAGIEHEDVVAHMRGEAQVMRDEQQRRAVIALHAADDLHDMGLRAHVERRRRLVGDDQGGLAGEGHGDEHALAHAARELERIALQQGSRDREAGHPPAPRWPGRAARPWARRAARDARRTAVRPSAPGSAPSAAPAG